MEEIYFVSGNKNKYEEIQKIININLGHFEINLEEIQSKDIYEIVREKAKFAYNILKKPVIVEDVGFYLECLNQFPGPLIKFLIGSIGPEGISNLVKNYKEKACVVRCVLCFFDGKKFNFFTGDVNGKIVKPIGRKGFGFDPIFKPKGNKKTFAQMTKAQKNKISHRSIAWNKFGEFLGK
ncbi:RdgB/HAM1 family non-canonical purine NTP pyrophosphatase [Candidatus Pacearchaeota archaeon]|nr:RdgB/HAM1 family non-canonical purine NTP pyrophosphatase [Candidatus Pacearchaeota archaeon]